MLREAVNQIYASIVSYFSNFCLSIYISQAVTSETPPKVTDDMPYSGWPKLRHEPGEWLLGEL